MVFFSIELINFFIRMYFAGQRTYVDYLGGLVLSRTFTCHEIIILGRVLWKIVILIFYAFGAYACMDVFPGCFNSF